ncbi:MAG: aldo/keto reductase [Verrucomicrobia bacterium]|nr:aldo/keto reductase [Verrucomicrobiota bacterium]
MRNTYNVNRRDFLKTSAVAAGAVLVAPSFVSAEDQAPQKKIRTAADQVELGNTGVKLSRLGFGTGTSSGNVQRALGHEGFNSLIRHAYDKGITYFDTAESYQTHSWLKEALKGLPREKLFIQTKMPGWGVKTADEAFEKIEKYLTELGTDYIDSLLIHCQTAKDWDTKMTHVMEAMSKAKEKKLIRVHGISTHSIPAIRTGVASDWVQTLLVRLNPQGHITDTEDETWNSPSSVKFIPEVVKQIKNATAKGKGVIAMKLIGEGNFKKAEDRQKAMNFVMATEGVNSAVVGFKSTAEVDESIERMNSALKES